MEPGNKSRFLEGRENRSETFKLCYSALKNFHNLDPKQKRKVGNDFIDLIEDNMDEASELFFEFIELFGSDPKLQSGKEEFEQSYKGDLIKIKAQKLLPMKIQQLKSALNNFNNLPESAQREKARIFVEICEMDSKQAYELFNSFKEVFENNQRLKAIKGQYWNELKQHIKQFKIKSNYTFIEEINNIKVYQKGVEWLTTSEQKNARNLLVVGETGSGKTTLLNSMTTYLLGINYFDTVRVKTIVEKSGLSQSHSQTSKVTEYVLNPDPKRFPYPIRFIDTPGLGDTRGLQYDQDNIELIRNYFKKAKNDLHGICFVIKASTNRITSTLAYFIHQILCLFGKDIVDNFFAMITFADYNDPAAIAAMRGEKIPIKKWFRFNNSAFFPTKNDDNDERMSALAWEMGAHNFKQFFEVLEGIEPVSLDMTLMAILTKEYLELSVRGIQLRINEGIIQKKNLQEKYDVFTKNYDLITSNSNFSYDEYYEELVQRRKPPGYFTTNCTKCSMACHENCKYKDNDDKENCLMMSDGYCTVCPGKCHWSVHFNLGYYHEKVRKKRTVTGQEAKTKFFTGVSYANNAKSILNQIDMKIKEETNSIIRNVEEASEIMEKMKKYSMRTSQVDMSNYLKTMIEKEKSDKKDGYQERIRQIESVRDQNNTLMNFDNLNEIFNPTEIEKIMSTVRSKGRDVDRIVQSKK